MSHKANVMLVDLDGTLADDTNVEYPEIGPPIESMVNRVKWWLSEGTTVRIHTARMDQDTPQAEQEMRVKVQRWCISAGIVDLMGNPLAVTNRKDRNCNMLWDDRAKAVEKNTGRILGFRNNGTGYFDMAYDNVSRCKDFSTVWSCE